ncbi:hypothetical protein ABDI30_20965 [Paenibacillus cisolokensis]
MIHTSSLEVMAAATGLIDRRQIHSRHGLLGLLGYVHSDLPRLC